VAQDLGNTYPRKVNYFPQTGRAQMKKLRATDSETIVNREMNYLHDLNHLNVGGEVELW
jgi:chemotaxis protein CheD